MTNSEASTATIGRRTVLMAELGPENPLPMVGAPLETPYEIAPPIPAEIIEASRYGNPTNLFPYSLQDGYTRHRAPRELQTVVLENEHLRAVFLPELGGRLWELFDKSRGKQLLHTPPTIQFANLALRNAWFAGGIEWNIGTRGHSPTTCGPVHTALLDTPDGQTVLRMWEFERLRGVVFTVDAWLPADSRLLFTTVRIVNRNEADVPMYWWTNAAVPQDTATRVIAPATSAFRSDAAGAVVRTNPTDDGGVDGTWPSRSPGSRDYFFDIPPDRDPWIVAADGDGDGLALLSTRRLRGRKLFTWGAGAGGERWQEWLSPGDGRYAEIQAGLLRTQFEHLPLPAGAEFSWTEAYGNGGLEPRIAAGDDWLAAQRHAADRLAGLLGPADLDEVHARMRAWTGERPQRRVRVGTGWGALEGMIRARSGRPPVEEPGAPFEPDTLGGEQRPWVDLLATGTFSGAGAFVAGEDWEARLQAAPESAQGLLHLAVLAHATGRLTEAAERYQASLRLDPTGIGWRGLALVALAAGEVTEALAAYEWSCRREPDSIPLLVEAATALIRHGEPGRAVALIEQAGPAPSAHGRIRFLLASALAAAGRRDEAAELLDAGLEVPDIREGENSLFDLWNTLRPGVAVPLRYQFGMH